MRSVIAVACAVLALAAVARADEATITIASGTLQGTVNFAANTRDFLGIPFAQPPVGALRWADPLPALPWNGVLNATAFGIGCIQQCDLPPGTCPWGTSEDCLTLNVYTPRVADIAGPLPVMFFIPGGRFEQGASGTYLYAGDVLANSTNTVVVTTNYRLGLFGFMASTTIAGSYGIKDQRLALQWVQQNIAAFGGDPTRVTIFGQSAGASSVATHLTTAKSKGLFHQAISQSNPFTLPFHTPAEAEKLTNAVCAKVGCGNNDIECLRAVDAPTLLAAAISVENALNISNLPATFYPWTPLVDGVDLTDQPVVLLNTSAFNAVPLIVGNVEQEALMFVWEADSKNLTDVEYVAALALIFKDDYAQVHAMYPANHWIWENGDNRPVLANLSTSYLFMCPSRMVARSFVRAGQPVYSYHFNHAMSFDGWGPNFPFCVGEVCHGVELPFLFESISELGFQFTADEQVMATSLTTAWGNFAHTGNPNLPTPLELQWPAYSAEMDQILEFATPGNSVSQAFKAAECDLWDSVGYVTGNIPSQLLRARQLLKAQKIHLKI